MPCSKCKFQTVDVITCGKCFNEEKNLKIVQQLKQSKTRKQIAANMKCDLPTIARFTEDLLKNLVRKDWGKMKVISWPVNSLLRKTPEKKLRKNCFLKMWSFKISLNPPGAEHWGILPTMWNWKFYLNWRIFIRKTISIKISEPGI